MAQHKTLESMIETAQNRGTSTRKSWTVDFEVTGTGIMYDLGYKKEEQRIETYTIIHYGTPILVIKRVGSLMKGYKQDIHYTYGESKSDADAINAVLQYFGINSKRFTFKPVNGGFQEVK